MEHPVAESGYAFGNNDAGKSADVCECVVADGLDSARNSEVAFIVTGNHDKGGLVFVVKNAVFHGHGLCAVNESDLCDASCFTERVSADVGKFLAEIDGGKSGAVEEALFADLGKAVAEGYRNERSAVCECVALNSGDRIGDDDLLNRGSLECASLDGGQGVGKADGLESSLFERVLCDGGNGVAVDLVGNYDVFVFARVTCDGDGAVFEFPLEAVCSFTVLNGDFDGSRNGLYRFFCGCDFCGLGGCFCCRCGSGFIRCVVIAARSKREDHAECHKSAQNGKQFASRFFHGVSFRGFIFYERCPERAP